MKHLVIFEWELIIEPVPDKDEWCIRNKEIRSVFCTIVLANQSYVMSSVVSQMVHYK